MFSQMPKLCYDGDPDHTETIGLEKRELALTIEMIFFFFFFSISSLFIRIQYTLSMSILCLPLSKKMTKIEGQETT